MSQLFVQDDSDDEGLQDELSRQIKELKELQEKILVEEPKVGSGVDVVDETSQSEKKKTEKVEEEEDKVLYPLIPNDKYEYDDKKPDINDIRSVNINLSLPLSFQQQVVENALVSNDPLVILGKGLGMMSIVSNLLHILATPTKLDGKLKRSLVLVLNATQSDNQRIGEELQELFWLSDDDDDNNLSKNGNISSDQNGNENPRSFNVVTADSLSVEKRSKLYLSGGIISVTSRILIVDLLSGIIHPNRITGIVVLNVENLRHYSNESFIIEIFRSKNKWGFLKGFSESPESFVMEFSPLMRKMKDLKFKNVLLWPRFRVEISSCLNDILKQKSQKVIEIKVSLTNSMSQIQFGLIECLKKCIAELIRKNSELALDWWNIENALDLNFQRSIDSVMVPNWHRISFESKQLVKDIRFLRHLMKLLVTSDSVTFYEELQLSLEANKPSISRKYTESPWLMATESQLVISHSRKRIYDNERYQLEEQPKWEQVLSILEDISYQRNISKKNGPTLIACSDPATCRQITSVLAYSNRKDGIKNLMNQKLNLYRYRKEENKRLLKEANDKETQDTKEIVVSTAFVKEEVVSKRRRTRGAATVAAVERLRNAGAGEDIENIIDDYDVSWDEMSRVIDEEVLGSDEYIKYSNEAEDEAFESDTETAETCFSAARTSKEVWEKVKNDYHYINCNDQIIVDCFANLNDETALQEVMPSHIIMYEPDLTFVRNLEIYRAINHEQAPVIYFMYYGDSIEEQRHLTAIKKEKDAFTKLIRENAMLAQHFETEGDLSHYKNLADRKLQLSRLRNTSTRIAGGQNLLHEVTQDVVIVDSREFNASLPGLLYRYGVCVIPCMLTVGDYIITPDICIERKSVADLIGSFLNNRLESQCKKMAKYYKFPTLLIEFDEDQSFSLEPFAEKRSYRRNESSTVHQISSTLSQFEIQMKLSKLALKFPNLKIIWSSSPLQTVNIILELKLGRSQPDPSVSMALGVSKNSRSQPTSVKTNNETNDELYKTLLDIPGLSKVDYFSIRKKVKKFSVLKKLSKEDLTNLVDDEGLAQKIFNFLNIQEDEI
ncbi:hypothetical protein Kpol_1007p11 [Vanderwaltozyma polyspora DSM 70294]|uniref:ERCC4 domain-containing protein n=1 Tax=Vanderwaltozyma polyspora (strain ATCC 22028 / DSM 70294 / BCRC 21397 / CBS 2163 / NBRC 10782 / NRRL Y-8283 / UCD 57-17) TaxID=436907 RepID=A7TRT3_VANPO|nr:uncharacterized protein Kpol_1007p11 [Vanderwaltozyma polyspora DSM 70294]EDO15027.1 hypothetical protein Kpol_1007p11 [Vanderwaltozyma polyspora DSM 70294]